MTTSALLEIRHETGFTYDGAATSSYNEVRMTPPTLARQRVLATSLSTWPTAVQATYLDYFGSIVTTFDLHERHDRLLVVAEATVETRADDGHPSSVTLADVAEPDLVDRLTEYLTPTHHTSMSRAVLAEYRRRATKGGAVDDVAAAIISDVRERVAYRRGSTEVSSTAQDVWELREGVCQDLTHVTVALLRASGVPARYVSGYLHPDFDGELGRSVVGESHAWVEYFNGEWTGVDPTTGAAVGLGHVVVAKGREYSDVPPLKGIYLGDPSSALGVTVSITRRR